MNVTEVVSQQQLDAIPSDYDGQIRIHFGTQDTPAVVHTRYPHPVEVTGSSCVLALGLSSLTAKDNSLVYVYGLCQVDAQDRSCVIVPFSDRRVGCIVQARDNSIVDAAGICNVFAQNASQVIARKGCIVDAWGTSTILTTPGSLTRAHGSNRLISTAETSKDPHVNGFRFRSQLEEVSEAEFLRLEESLRGSRPSSLDPSIRRPPATQRNCASMRERFEAAKATAAKKNAERASNCAEVNLDQSTPRSQPDAEKVIL